MNAKFMEDRVQKLELNMNVARQRIISLEKDNSQLSNRLNRIERMLKGNNNHPGNGPGWEQVPQDTFVCQAYCTDRAATAIDKSSTYIAQTGVSAVDAFKKIQSMCTGVAYDVKSYGNVFRWNAGVPATPQESCKEMSKPQAPGKLVNCQAYCVDKNAQGVDKDAKLVLDSGFSSVEAFNKVQNSCNGVLFTMSSFGKVFRWDAGTRATIENSCNF